MTCVQACLTTLTALCLVVSSPVLAQGQASASRPIPDAIVQDLGSAFSNGDAQALLDHATDRVEISLFGTRTYYSRAQALYVLRDFFKKHPPQRFESDEVAEAGTTYFVTGRYWHLRTDQPLQLYVRVSTESEDWNLHEVRIERMRP